jgi:hypothetical protein
MFLNPAEMRVYYFKKALKDFWSSDREIPF